MTAAADDAQAGVGHAPGHEARVGERHDRVLVAGEDQGRLAQCGAATAGSSSPRWRRAGRRSRAGRGAGRGGRRPGARAARARVGCGRRRCGGPRSGTPMGGSSGPARRAAGRGSGLGGTPPRPGAVAHRIRRRTRSGRAARQLLCEAASERVAEDVDPPSPSSSSSDDHAQRRARPSGAGAKGAASRPLPGGSNAITSLAGHEPDERLPHVQIRSDPRDQQQRRAAARARDPQPQPGRAHDERLPAHAKAPTPVMSRPTISACIVSVPS